MGDKASGSGSAGERKKSLVNRIIETFMALLNEIYLGEETYTKVSGKLVNAIKVFIVASRKFMLDDCYEKASAIAYTTIISLIPTLTVGLTFYSIFAGMGDKKEELFDRATTFMLEHNIKLNIDPVIETISSLIENAGKIGGVGAVVMIFTATAVLRTLEKSLNDIWGVKKQRALYLKVIYYWAALTLGPIMLIAGTTVATQLSAFFSPPAFKSAVIASDGTLWVTGSKAAVRKSSMPALPMKSITTDRIDFENQKTHEYDPASRAFKEHEFRVEEAEFGKSEFTDIQFIDRSGWAVGKNGMVLFTRNGGQSWMLEKFGAFNLTDIHMIDGKTGFIAAENGLLLKTTDGGGSWTVITFDNYTSNLNSITFYNGKGVITGDRGALMLTADGGKTWKVTSLSETRRKKRPANLNRAQFVNGNAIWLVADEGLVFFSRDGGASWQHRKFLEKSYHALFFFDERTGYVGGEDGTLLYTGDGGGKWTRKTLHTPRINGLVAAGGAVVAVGDAGMIMKSGDNGKTWSGLKGGNFVGYLLNFFAPFVFIWLLFLLTYLLLPNMKVAFTPAALGASFTGAVWVVFILLFIVYVKSFAGGTVAVYGGLAAIPLFLLMVYASTLIILYGAEIAFTLMHPHTYRNLRRFLKDKKEVTVFYGIAVLYTVYKNFESGKGPTFFKDLLKITSNKADDVDYFTALFKKENLIIESAEGGYMPATASTNVLLADVVDLVHDASLVIPAYAPSDNLKKYFNTLFESMKKSRKKVMEDITLAKLIEEVG